jgi:hypothetical protein
MVSPRVPYPCRACDEPVPVRTSSFDRVGGRLSDDNRREPASDCRRHRPERPDALSIVLAQLPRKTYGGAAKKGSRDNYASTRCGGRWTRGDP